MSEAIYSGTIHAKWHALFVDILENERSVWLQIAETRPNGRRQAIVIEQERWAEFQGELLKAVSAVGARTDQAHSASAVRTRSYAEWTSEEDDVLQFLLRTGAGLAAVASALQRERSAIRSRLKHLKIEGAEA